MSDFNSSLPVRTINNGDVAVKVVDATTVSQGLAVDASGRVSTKLDDGSGNAVTSQVNGTQRALDVGIDVAGVQIDPRSIRALTSADVVTAQQGTSPWVTKDQADGPVAPGTAASFSELVGGQYNSTGVTLTTGQQSAVQLDAAGNLKVNLSTAIPAGSNIIGSVKLDDGSGNTIGSTAGALNVSLTTAIPAGSNVIGSVNQGTSPWVTSDAADGSVTGGTAGTKSMLGGAVYNTSAPTLTNGQQAALQSDVNGNLKVDLATAIPAGSNLIGAVNLDIGGSAVSNTNPVPVTITTAVAGTAVQNFTDLPSIAIGGNATATYTVAASHTFTLQRIFVSSEARIKIVVQAASSTIFTAFNSSANPNIDITVVTPPTLAAAATVTVQVTNLDLGVSDAYVTIEGNQN